MQLNIGNKIRELRKRDGHTQEALAEAIGVTSQAISRWEANGGYPDMETIPSIANFFGVSIDELFGYENDREKKVDEIVSRIDEMNFQNNGVDINIDECISLAREAIIEFPANEKVLFSLGSVLYNAGYVRYGEYHLTDSEGYDVYDVERHREYAEWREAISIFEKLLGTLEAGTMRDITIQKLTQLYLNTGEHERARAIIETLPSIYGSREFLLINAADGKEHAAAYGKALLRCVRASAELIVGAVISYEQNMSPSDKADSIISAIGLFEHVCTDGNYGVHNSFISRMYSLLSVYLWVCGKRDEAFEALDRSLEHFKKFEECSYNDDVRFYTSPLIKLVEIEKLQATANSEEHPHTNAKSLSEDWPWWSVSEYSLVCDEIKADPRWAEWEAKLG